MKKTMIDSYNELVPTMNKLIREGKDIWEFHGSLSGFGFKLIEKDFYIQVTISAYIDDDNQFFITKHKKNGNVFSCMDETLAESTTTNAKCVYDLIKEML